MGSFLPEEKLFTIAKMCGGLAVLMLFAVFLSGLGLSANNLAAAVSATQTIGNSTLTLSASSQSVTSGSSVNITWSATNISGYTTPPKCFGDGVSKCNTIAQHLTVKGGYDVVPGTVFQYNGTWYMITTENSTVNGNFLDMYQWMPAGTPSSNTTGCFGSGSACGSLYASMSFSGKAPGPPVVFITSTGVPVMGVTLTDNTGATAPNIPADIELIFKWIDSKSCFGDGTTCSNPSQQFTVGTGGKKGWGAPTFFTVAGQTYAFIGTDIKKWSSGSFVGTSIPSFGGGVISRGGSALGAETATLVSSPQTLSPSYPYTQPLLLVTYYASANNYTTSVYPWNPTLASGGCFGTTACWTALQTFSSQAILGHLSGAGGHYNATGQAGSVDYLELMRANAYPYNHHSYQWIPSLLCYGAAGVCNTSASVNAISGMNNTTGGDPTKYIVNGQIIPTNTIGNTTYLLGGFPIEDGPISDNSDVFYAGHYSSDSGVTRGLFKPTWAAGSVANSCKVTAQDSSGTRSFGTGITGGPISSGALTVSTTYTLSCDGVAGSTSVLVTVTASPTATINAGAGNGITKTATVGMPLTITATYAAGAGDTLAATAINDDSTVTSVSCSNVTPANPSNCWTIPDATKVYTFTPAAVGTKTYSAQIKTANLTTYNSYKTVTVNFVCPAGASGSACNVCANGYGWNGTSCAVCPAGQHSDNTTNPFICVPDTRTCTVSNGSGVQTWNGTSWGTCGAPITCDSGFTLQGSSCVADTSGNLILTASPLRVRAGTAVSLTWTGQGLPASCTMSSMPGVSGFPIFVSSGSTGSVAPVSTGPVKQKTVFTITCGAASANTTVNLIPAFQEI